MDILAELTELKKQYAAANELLEQAGTQADAAKALFAAKEQALIDEQAKVASGVEALAAKDAELAAKVAEITALAAKVEELTAGQKTVEQKAVELVASQGVAPTKAASGNSGTNKADVLAEYAAIKDPVEAGQFYAKNRAIILS